MKTIRLINRHAITLVVVAACINFLFLYLHNPHIYFAISQAHGQIGYHLYHCNKIGIDSLLTKYVNNEMSEQQKLIDYDAVSCHAMHQHEAFPINDTIGYGILLGLLWKITGSLCFFDVQLLQIIMFSILMLFYYQLAYLLFESTSIAFLCGIAHLLFFPLLAYNVMPVRDIWAYYGLLILAYCTIAFYNKQLSLPALIAYLSFFACCLWMRPTLALASMLFSLLALRMFDRTKAITYIIILWAITGLFFWLPSMYYNQINYGRYFVSPAGQSLLEGLGELPNPWRHQLNDEYVSEFIGTKYHLKYGTPAFDEAAMHEFVTCVKENPWHYIKTLLYRLPDILLPGLQWIFYTQSPYAACSTLGQKLQLVCSCQKQFFDFFARHIWMRLYVLLSYIGLYFMLRHKCYKAFWIIVIGLFSGLSTYPSHIEYRYIVPFYWILSLSLGYLWYYVLDSYNKNRRSLHAKDNHTLFTLT